MENVQKPSEATMDMSHPLSKSLMEYYLMNDDDGNKTKNYAKERNGRK